MEGRKEVFKFLTNTGPLKRTLGERRPEGGTSAIMWMLAAYNTEAEEAATGRTTVQKRRRRRQTSR